MLFFGLSFIFNKKISQRHPYKLFGLLFLNLSSYLQKRIFICPSYLLLTTEIPLKFTLGLNLLLKTEMPLKFSLRLQEDYE